MSRPAWVEIDLAALQANYAAAKKAHGGRVFAVLKANAYGHGALACAQALAASSPYSTMVVFGDSLADAGHRQFAVIDGPGDSAVAQERKAGVLDRLFTLGLPAPIVVSGNYDYASGGRGLRKVIDVSGDGVNNQGPPVALARRCMRRAC